MRSTRVLRPTTDPVALPQPEPGTVRELLIVPAIRGRDVARLEWPSIRQSEHALQALDLIDDLFRVHSPHYLPQSLSTSNPTRVPDHPSGHVRSGPNQFGLDAGKSGDVELASDSNCSGGYT